MVEQMRHKAGDLGFVPCQRSQSVSCSHLPGCNEPGEHWTPRSSSFWLANKIPASTPHLGIPWALELQETACVHAACVYRVLDMRTGPALWTCRRQSRKIDEGTPASTPGIRYHCYFYDCDVSLCQVVMGAGLMSRLTVPDKLLRRWAQQTTLMIQKRML